MPMTDVLPLVGAGSLDTPADGIRDGLPELMLGLLLPFSELWVDVEAGRNGCWKVKLNDVLGNVVASIEDGKVSKLA